MIKKALALALLSLFCTLASAQIGPLPGMGPFVIPLKPVSTSITITRIGEGNTGGTGNPTITGVTVPGGSFIGVFVNENCANTTGISVTDGTNTYSQVTLAQNGALCYGFFQSTNISGISGATITFVQHSSTDSGSLAAFYITGAATSSAVDSAVTNTASGSSTSPSVTSAGTAGQSGEMTVGVTWGLSCGTFTQAGGSWSNVNNKVCNPGAAATLIGDGSQVNSGTGTLTYNPTLGTSQTWEAGIYGIKHQ